MTTQQTPNIFFKKKKLNSTVFQIIQNQTRFPVQNTHLSINVYTKFFLVKYVLKNKIQGNCKNRSSRLVTFNAQIICTLIPAQFVITI